MRILSILPFSPPSPKYGGAERQMHSLHKGLKARGIEIHVLADIRQVTREFQEVEGLPVWGVPFPVLTAHPIRPGNIKLWHDWRKIRRVVLERIPRPDLIQVSTFRQPALVGYRLAGELGLPWVVRLACSGSQGDFTFSQGNWLLRLYMSRMVKAVTCVIALDDQTRAEAMAHGISEDRIRVIQNGLVFQQPPVSIGRSFADHYLSILYLGRLAQQKRVDTLIEAFSLMKGSSSSTMTLRVVGGGDLQADLEQRAGKLGISSHCVFQGQIACPEDELLCSNCFVNPSESEGLPNAVLEAAAFGLPLILSDIPIHRQIATAVGMTNYLFPVGDAEALAERMIHFCNLGAEEKAQLSDNCSSYGQRFVPEIRDQAYNDLYRQILAERRVAC